MAWQIFIFSRGDRRHVAGCEDGRLISYGVTNPRRVDRAGAIHLGRVARMDRPMGAAFVLFDGAETGMLPLAGSQRLSEGEHLLVQVLRDRRGEKSVRLTRAIVLASRYLQLRVHRPGIETYPQLRPSAQTEAARKALAPHLPPEHGVVLRPAAELASASELTAELERLLAQWRAISELAAAGKPPQSIRPADDPLDLLLCDAPQPGETTIHCPDRRTAQLVAARIVERQFADFPIRVAPTNQWAPSLEELDESVEAALGAEVPISGGGSLLFEPGQTLTAVDVNAGDAVGRGGGGKDPERARFALNRAAAAEIARQLRLRNIGGLIVIDFIGLRRPTDRRDVVEDLRRACCADSQPCQILEMSRFGLVEMMRQSAGATLAEQLRTEP